jgi:inositol-1,3,4-trisphosphate 5/6-kinase / inositol-tetrakisphosphate 1-kinase
MRICFVFPLFFVLFTRVGKNNFHIVQRNSIRNLEDFTSKQTIAFHSSEVSSSQADHILVSIDPALSMLPVNEPMIKRIAQIVQNLFELNLVGIDIIIDRITGHYAVIDVNYFPGYEGITNFSTELFQLCQRLLHLS